MADVIDVLQLNIGETFSISVKTGRIYKSVLQDGADKYLMLSAPTYKGIPVIFHKGDKVTLHYFRETGRMAIDARVVGFKLEGNIRNLIFEPYGPPRKEQLRDSFRLTGLRVKCVSIKENDDPEIPLPDEAEWFPGSVVDISESGICISSRIKYQVGNIIRAKVYLQWPEENSPPLELRAEVKRSEVAQSGGEGYITGAKIANRDEALRRHISKYVLVRQQEMLRQTRQLSEERKHFRPGDRKRER